MTETGEPLLQAWIDDDGMLHVTVESDGTTYDRTESDLGILLQNKQYSTEITRPALTLLTLYQRELADEDFEPVEADDLEELEAD